MATLIIIAWTILLRKIGGLKLVQRYTTLLLALLIMLNTLAMPLIYLDFKLNQDFIAKVLCINRDKPITTCNGQCYLNRQLKKQQEKEKTPQHQTTKKQTYETFCLVLFDFRGLTFADISVQFPDYQLSFTSPYLSSFFHPPQWQG